MRRNVDGRTFALARKPAVPYDRRTPSGRGTAAASLLTEAQSIPLWTTHVEPTNHQNTSNADRESA